ncbi:hypothetical protein EYM_03080 [Ignicoccus islandicus DSM 13165]|uniref:Uncharacterized protein n=2 Tax=Ignicoccus islandicus TaxID=54259 RepID=A0A0U3FSC1_9CREN|nr:hypothetical protein EYM_03080 [Ignicoccus islandicus DSM 13165]
MVAKICNDWKIALGDLSKWLSFDLRKDFRAVSELEKIRLTYRIPHFDCLVVIGPQYESTELPKDCSTMVVDSALNVFDGHPDVIVSDMDGVTLERLKEEMMAGSTLFLVAHGDNFEKILQVVKVLEDYGNVILVSQLLTPSLRIPCIPAFSDGDKAIFIARLISRKVKIFGFDTNYQSTRSKSVELSTKLRKIALSRAYGTIIWSRYYGELPVPAIG